jgi:hypothetical protein
MMRRLAVLAGVSAVFFALVALALASPTPTVTYNSPIKQTGKPKAGKPAPVQYDGILDVKNPDGTQPATGSPTTLYFAKQLVNNGKYFPSCSVTDIDGKTSVPAKCKKAVIGKGTAASQAGTPGTASIINEPLAVTAYNGPKGKQLLLVLNATSPVAVQNRVVPGTFGPGSGQFGYTLKFQVPADLQQQLGLQISLTHFDVVISAKTISAKIKGKKKKVSYLALTKCPKSKTLPVKAVVNFNNDAAQPGGPVVTATSTTKCK